MAWSTSFGFHRVSDDVLPAVRYLSRSDTLLERLYGSSQWAQWAQSVLKDRSAWHAGVSSAVFHDQAPGC